jgi:HPt (histidine-containing phosphotransfer) domain-containing protein
MMICDSTLSHTPAIEVPREAEALLDLPSLLDRVAGDTELLRDVVDLFLTTLDTQLEEIQRAVQACDARKLERAAHAIKGAAANLSALHASEAAKRVELLARDARIETFAAAFDSLREALDRTRPVLLEAMATAH